ncbi:MAG: zinc-binding dehydrogenase, partial [Caldilineaceae bacterium]|nr:zinc-binding dehydrogenase [Caldilineaceae bacterium]
FPFLLGHEAAGVVEAVGEGVTNVAPGDYVILNWRAVCGNCRSCLKGKPWICFNTYNATQKMTLTDGTALTPALGIGAFADKSLVHEAQCTKVDDEADPAVAGLLGCGVMAGIGAAINTGAVGRDDTVAVIGCGGVGLSAIQGCKLAGCYPIIAVDVMESKLAFARELGATHTINAAATDPVRAARELTRLGPDYAFDSVGATATINQALQMVRPGGTATVMGLHGTKVEAAISPAVLILANKRLLGCFAGSSRPLVDLPKLLDLYLAGRLDLDKLISKHYALDELPQAFDDMTSGAVARGVITF